VIEFINNYVTFIEVLSVNYDDHDQAVATVRRAEFDSLTGAQSSIKEITLTKHDVVAHRQWLLSERQRLVALLADFDAFIVDAQAAIDQWLIDNPPP